MNAVQEHLLEQAIAAILLTLTRAEGLPTLTERAAIYESRLTKTLEALRSVQVVELARRERERASAGAAA